MNSKTHCTDIEIVLKEIRKKREEIGYSQEYIAECLKVGQATYNKIEKGKIKLKVEHLIVLLDILDLSMKDIRKAIKENKEIPQFQLPKSFNNFFAVNKKVQLGGGEG